jgi:hypothetical protein
MTSEVEGCAEGREDGGPLIGVARLWRDDADGMRNVIGRMGNDDGGGWE